MKRKRGGQPGHPRHERAALPPEQVDHVSEYRLDVCPDCACASLQPSPREPEVVQQVESVAKPFVVEEHRAFASICPQCRKLHYAPLPEAVEKGGLLGPRLTAQVAYLKAAGHMSYLDYSLPSYPGMNSQAGRKKAGSACSPFQMTSK